MEPHRQIFIQILDIINFSGNKDEFTNSFFQLIYQSALLHLIQTLSPEKQQEFLALSSADSLDKTKNSILQFFTQERINQAVNEETTKQVQEYINTIMPTLTEQQKGTLFELRNTLSLPKAKP